MPAESETSRNSHIKAIFPSRFMYSDVNGNNTEAHTGEPIGYMQALTSNSLVNNTTRGPKFYCYQCDYFLHTQLSMNTHMKMHRKPFCPICFEVFEDSRSLSEHSELHLPVLYPNLSFPVVPMDGVFKDEDHFLQTGAPPNSPNHESAGLHALLCAPDSDSFHFHLAEKLRNHQNMLNFSVRQSKNGGPMRDQHGISNGRGARKKNRPSIIGTSGKVLKKPVTPKASRTKTTASPRAEHEDRSENVLKRITSRFGRAISLKVPQF